MTAAVVWIDGAIVPADEARVPVLDRGFLYGDSIYEVMRARRRRPFALAAHLDRLESSAAGISMTPPPRAEVIAAVDACLAAAAVDDAYVRIVVTRGGGPIGLDPALAEGSRLVVLVRPVEPPPPAAYRDGVGLAVVARGRHGGVDPSVKSGNYLASVLGVAEARRRGAYECVFTDAQGRITEGGSSNLFVAMQGRLWTPPLSVGILPGITRATLIALCRQAGVSVDERPLWPADLAHADEAFITSSIRGVLPVTRVDGAPLGDGTPGVLTQRVMALYDAAVQGGLEPSQGSNDDDTRDPRRGS